MTDTSVETGPWGPRPAPAAETARWPAGGETPEAVDLPLVFNGARRSFARLTARGLFLYVPTFGFNRFWLRTDQRRFMWLNTTLGGDSFEYRGNPMELVVGFLLAIGIYMPLALAYSVLGLYAESVQTYASVPFFILTFAFGHFAAFRARRYRLTRTGFRGIRFWMVGSGWEMGFKAFAYLILVGLTAGIAWPWMQAWLERYKMQRSRYGNLSGDFLGKGSHLMKAMMLPALSLLIAGSILVSAMVILFTLSLQSSHFDFLFGAASSVVVVLFVACAWSVMTAVRMKWWINHVAFGHVRAQSTLGAFRLVMPAFRAAVLAIMFMLLWFAPAALGAFAFGTLEPASPFQSIGLAILALLWSLVGLVILMYIKNVFYNFDLIQRIAATTTIQNASTLEGVTADGRLSGIVGEGLADALGADGF